MMTHERDALVDTLLEVLESERYVRASLLLTVIDELSAGGPLAPATEPATSLLAAIESNAIGDDEFVARVRELRELVRDLRQDPVSGVRPRVIDVRRPSAWPTVTAGAA